MSHRPSFVFAALIAGACLPAAAPSAMAADDPPVLMCDDVPVGGFGPEEEVLARVESLGYRPVNLKIEKGCWEVKAIDKNDLVFEIYIHPVSGDVMLRKMDTPEDFDGPDD